MRNDYIDLTLTRNRGHVLIQKNRISKVFERDLDVQNKSLCRSVCLQATEDKETVLQVEDSYKDIMMKLEEMMTP